jgi:hypothetical protein
LLHSTTRVSRHASLRRSARAFAKFGEAVVAMEKEHGRRA